MPKTFFRQSFPDFVLWLYYASVDFVIVLLLSHTKKMLIDIDTDIDIMHVCIL